MSHPIRRAVPFSLLVALTSLWAGSTTPIAQERSTPFPVASVFFELNHSAGDLGLHGEIDAAHVKFVGERDNRRAFVAQ